MTTDTRPRTPGEDVFLLYSIAFLKKLLYICQMCKSCSSLTIALSLILFLSLRYLRLILRLICRYKRIVTTQCRISL